VELFPDILQGCRVYVCENDAAAGSAEDVSEGVDVDAFGSEEGGFAIE